MFLGCATRELGSAGLFLLVFLDCQRVQISLNEPCPGMIVAEYFLRFFHCYPALTPQRSTRLGDVLRFALRARSGLKPRRTTFSSRLRRWIVMLQNILQLGKTLSWKNTGAESPFNIKELRHDSKSCPDTCVAQVTFSQQ
jgi:hypothetical protein